jgi:hypothetical protein
MANDVKTIVIETGNLGAGGTQPLIYFPPEGGDITILHAKITGTGGGTPVGLKLVSMSNLAAPAFVGTVCSWAGTFVAGTLTMAAGSCYDASIKTARFTADQWLAVGNHTGTVLGTAWITVNYVQGVMA